MRVETDRATNIVRDSAGHIIEVCFDRSRFFGRASDVSIGQSVEIEIESKDGNSEAAAALKDILKACSNVSPTCASKYVRAIDSLVA